MAQKKKQKKEQTQKELIARQHLGVIILQVPWNTVALQNCETATANSGTTLTQKIEQHH